MDNLLHADIAFEKINTKNVNAPSEKIMYTTCLKYKGLEKDLAVVVIKDLFDEKIKSFYQMFIGVSRAKVKVILLIDEGSAKIAGKAKEQTLIVEKLSMDN
jgi:hypothetical protein